MCSVGCPGKLQYVHGIQTCRSINSVLPITSKLDVPSEFQEYSRVTFMPHMLEKIVKHIGTIQLEQTIDPISAQKTCRVELRS